MTMSLGIAGSSSFLGTNRHIKNWGEPMDDFSVIMSVYKNDDPVHFRKALDSIINQTVVPSEIVLVIDGPVPTEIARTIDDYQNKHHFLKPIALKKNEGLGHALRIAVENASFELIARMDSDDISVSNRFEKQLLQFKDDKYLSVVGGNITEFIGEESNPVGRRVVPTDHEDIERYLRKRCPFNHVAVMFRKSSVLHAGNYKEWFWNEDYYLWVRMHEASFKFSNIDATLVNVRVGPDMYRRRGGLRYFRSEAALQRYMLRKRLIRFDEYVFNVAVRFVLQVLTPSTLRGFIFRQFAREKRVEMWKN